MRKLLLILTTALFIVSCENEAPKDYVTLQGTVTNQNSDSIIVANRNFKKKIMVNEDGTFSDTLKVEPGNYVFFDGSEQASLYLENGYDLNVTLDTKEFDETIKFEGEGADANNYLAQKALMQERIFEDDSMFTLEKEEFDAKVNEIHGEFTNLLNSTQNLDSTFVAQQTRQFDGLKQFLPKMYEEKQYLLTVLGEGKPSPKFENYENYNGGTTSLDDLKGKYVYVDVWATWCAPCKAEIPYLKELEEEYRDKNIEFVSISVDKAKDHETWKNMVAEKELKGVQLFAENDWNSQFVKDYKINGIPRFILIDPDGNIITPDAPRPSSEKLIELFNEYEI
ncbi:MAG TPA: TlpA disulfide reductase family protein [Flavobacteriaceae bacterium]|nr:TlpA disulfide reductase family protein [Flavobacteriaceae bacterium]